MKVYILFVDIKDFDNKLIETKCIGVFEKKEDAENYQENCDIDKLIDYCYHISETYIKEYCVK